MVDAFHIKSGHITHDALHWPIDLHFRHEQVGKYPRWIASLLVPVVLGFALDSRNPTAFVGIGIGQDNLFVQPSFYVIRSCYINGKHSSKVVEKLGTYEELKKKHDDTVAWAKEYIQQLNELEKEQKREIVIHFKQSKPIPMDKQLQFSGGYLFLQSLYHQLGLPAICQDISSRYKFKFNLNECLSRLIYIRILYPSSKLSSYEYSKKMLEPHQMELHHLYRSLGILSAEDSFIQSQLYANSERLCAQNSKVLYYDCTNFFFEIEQEDGIRQYGPSKEHRSSLIVEMGLFMDGDGIPLAYCLHSGDTNEQVTLQPLH